MNAGKQSVEQNVYRQQLQGLCDDYQLGQICKTPTLLTGGYTHRVNYVQTDSGRYVIKQLHPLFARCEVFRERCLQSMRLATHLQTQGLPVNAPLSHADSQYYWIQGRQYFVVYPYVAGSVLTDNQIQLEHFGKIVKLCCQLQQQNVPKDIALGALNVLPEMSRLRLLAAQILKTQPQLDKPLHLFFDTLDESMLRASSYHHDHLQTRRISHGDLDPGNVIWDENDNPILTDWEWCGYADTWQEAWGIALSWSRRGEQGWDRQRFQAFWQAWLAQANLPVPAVDIKRSALTGSLYALCGYWCEWVEWTMHRLQHADCEAELLLSVDLLRGCVSSLTQIVQHEDIFIDWIHEVVKNPINR